jgi:hypothetical protein
MEHEVAHALFPSPPLYNKRNEDNYAGASSLPSSPPPSSSSSQSSAGAGAAAGGGVVAFVNLVVFELRGKQCQDLLNGCAPVRLLQGSDGEVCE